MLQPKIVNYDETTEFSTPERCHIVEISNIPDDEAVSIARARVEPGVTTAWHRLNGVAERYIIVSGTGQVEIGDLGPTEVVAGDVVIIPPDMRQRITNTGEVDLVFYAVCSPRFTSACYVSLE